MYLYFQRNKFNIIFFIFVFSIFILYLDKFDQIEIPIFLAIQLYLLLSILLYKRYPKVKDNHLIYYIHAFITLSLASGFGSINLIASALSIYIYVLLFNSIKRLYYFFKN